VSVIIGIIKVEAVEEACIGRIRKIVYVPNSDYKLFNCFLDRDNEFLLT
jgi:hypothetical protein